MSHANQGDLEKVKELGAYKWNSQFISAIDDALSIAKPTGERHKRERTKLTIKTLDKISGTGEWRSGLQSIIAFYLLDEHEGTKTVESMKQEDATQKVMEGKEQKSAAPIGTGQGMGSSREESKGRKLGKKLKKKAKNKKGKKQSNMNQKHHSQYKLTLNHTQTAKTSLTS